jgi:hypothetical protein
MIFVMMFCIFILGFIGEVGCFMDECSWVFFCYVHSKLYLVMIANYLYYHRWLIHRLTYLLLRFLIFGWIISRELMFLVRWGRFLWFIVKFIGEVFRIIFIVCHWLLSLHLLRWYFIVFLMLLLIFLIMF